MERVRCKWVNDDSLYQQYHDLEWGEIVYEDQKLFECLCLESFQSGLNWITILRKRENFRRAFDYFDFDKIVSYGDDRVEALLQDEGIIRHRKKIEATINNAKCLIELRKTHKSLYSFLWTFVGHVPLCNPSSEESKALANKIYQGLKSHGFKFIGPTTVLAYIQAIGIINDHEPQCFKYSQ